MLCLSVWNICLSLVTSGTSVWAKTGTKLIFEPYLDTFMLHSAVGRCECMGV